MTEAENLEYLYPYLKLMLGYVDDGVPWFYWHMLQGFDVVTLRNALQVALHEYPDRAAKPAELQRICRKLTRNALREPEPEPPPPRDPNALHRLQGLMQDMFENSRPPVFPGTRGPKLDSEKWEHDPDRDENHGWRRRRDTA